jgi:hypothetical protein
MTSVFEKIDQENFLASPIIRHGFTDYMRDYEVIVVGRRGEPFDDVHRYLFVGCVEACVATGVEPKTYASSIGDEFVYAGPDYPDRPEPDGYIWGVRYSSGLAGIECKPDGARSAEWSRKTDREMYEVWIDTDAFHLALVFFDFRYQFLGHCRDEFSRKQYPIDGSIGRIAT